MTTPTLVRATVSSPVADTLSGRLPTPPDGADLPPDPDRDFFNGCVTGWVDAPYVAAFGPHSPTPNVTLAATVARFAFTLEMAA